MSNLAKPINSTDATQHEPLAVRARTRREELVQILAELPADEKTERGYIELALASVDSLLTGDTEHLSDATASDLNRWLEGFKHLGETPTGAPKLAVVKDATTDKM